MKHSIRFITLGILALLSMDAFGKSPMLLVTPAKFQCNVQPIDLPEAENVGQTPFRVHVVGAAGKFDWRLPLYTSNNGFNDIATAQIGHAKADKHGDFVIAVTSMELGRVGSVNDLVLQVNNERGASAHCLLMPSAVAEQRANASLQASRAEIR